MFYPDLSGAIYIMKTFSSFITSLYMHYILIYCKIQKDAVLSYVKKINGAPWNKSSWKTIGLLLHQYYLCVIFQLLGPILFTFGPIFDIFWLWVAQRLTFYLKCQFLSRLE